MEIGELKSKCSFLKDIWSVYDMFIQNVYGSEYNEILISCDRGLLFQNPNMNEYKNMCKQLSRNMLLLASNSNYGGSNFSKYCDILYIWMYYEIKKKMLSNSTIEKIFQNSDKMITTKLHKTSCSYFSFNEKLQEPENLIKLRIFEHNTSTFQNILNNISNPNNCSCLKYVYDCINTYNNMNNRFCATDDHENITYKDTCGILKNFKTSYSKFFRNVNGVIYELPLLSDTTNAAHTPTVIDAPSCLSIRQKVELNFSGDDQSSGSKQISISTALSTMVGIPPFLALIYKFTSVGTWFRTTNRKVTDVFKNVDEEIEKKIYPPRHENATINSAQERYNVAYEQI
ncbi:VIR protein [Plasmodium vivax]|uniref:VIR protein n=1 Tax=Plasmodium vivax TaxID=5855 RepID=A0A1G4HDM3_PLAVI|nr:VIR protein [Plasmodium vivax]